MACDPPNIPTKDGIVGKPTKNGAQRRREYSVQRTGNEIIDRNLDQIRQALRENDRSLLTVENLIPDIVAGSATSTKVDNSTGLGSVPISHLENGAIRFVKTFRSFFRLDATNSDGWTADGISYIGAMGGVGMWVRLPIADPYWATQTAWYIDPAGTNPTAGGAAGDDEASGLTALAPIKSVAEWRRRIQGAVFTGTTRIVIHALSASAVVDDGQFHGFTTELTATTAVVIVGTPTVVGTGTITSYVPYAGNVRGKITDSAIPASWTASGFVSTTSASRFIRKAGGGIVPYAPLVKDLGAKTIQMGIVSNWDETNTSAVTFTETNFTNGDSYEVVSMPRWPTLRSQWGNVRYQCLDLFNTTSGASNQAFPAAQNNIVICGILDRFTEEFAVNTILYGCAILTSSFVFSGALAPVNSSFLGSLVQPLTSSMHWKGQTNVFVNCRLYLEKGSIMGSTGILRIYDAVTDPCIQLSTGSHAWCEGMVGEGNTNKLVLVDRGSRVFGAASITASTSDVLPYSVGGTSYATPVVDVGSGDGIYN